VLFIKALRGAQSTPVRNFQRGAVPDGRGPLDPIYSIRYMPEGAFTVKRLIHVLTLSAIAVLVFAAIAVAQDVPQGQAEGQEPSPNATDTNTATDTNSTSVQKRTTSRTTSSGTTTVDITDDAFDPSELNIAAGTTVTFVNNGTGPHTATADNNLFDTGELAQGESLDVYLEGAGSVTYHDELNPDMTGSITVG
jgi:plastocyanin